MLRLFMPSNRPTPARHAHRKCGRALAAAMAATLALAGAAEAQPVQSRRPRLTPVEAGMADVGPLGIGMRDQMVDLRVPTNFDRVYRVETPGRGGLDTQDTFVRMDGAVTAVFRRSRYTPFGDTILAEIPPDTRFYIGALPPELWSSPAESESPRPYNFLDLSVPTRLDPARLEAVAPPAPNPPTALSPPPAGLWTNEEYRRSRVVRLIDRAVAAH